MDPFQEAIASAFSDLPYFSPSSIVNTSSRCATSRILQLRWLGISTASVAGKIRREALQPSSEEFDSPRHHDWMCRNDCLEAMEVLCRQQQQDFTCILHHWQLFEPASSDMGYGDLVFTDPTTKRFICVQLDVFGTQEPKKLLQDSEFMGRGLFSLLTYIGYEPEWVRCTIWRDAMPRELPFLPQGLLGKQQGPGFTQIDASSFRPILLAAALDDIDKIVAKDRDIQGSINKYRAEAGGVKLLKERTLKGYSSSSKAAAATSKDAAATDQGSSSSSSSCACCDKNPQEAGVQALQRCSACKAVHYCNRDCQLADWSSHKAFCKQHRAKP